MNEPNSPWSLILARQPEIALQRLSRAAFRLVDRKLSALAQNPRPPEAQRLVGDGQLYRLRVEAWRIAYAVEDEQRIVLILEIVPRYQPERYQVEPDERPSPEELAAISAEAERVYRELYQASAANLTEEQKRQLLAEAFKLATNRHLLSPTTTRFSHIVGLIREMELLKRTVAAQLAEGRVQSGQPAWYVLYCHAGFEPKLKQNLLRRVQRFDLQDKVLRVVIPGEGETGPREADKPSIREDHPAAILVEMILDDEVWDIIRNTPGITAHFGSGDRPAPLQADQIELLLKDTTPPLQPSPQVGVTGPGKLRLFIQITSITLRRDIFEMVESSPELEIVTEAVEADLILTDVEMPTNFLPQRPPAGLLLLEIQDQTHYLSGPTAAGVSEFLKPPFSRDELIEALRKVHQSSLNQDPLGVALHTLKTIKLGRWVELSLSVADLSQSLLFYEKLGLKPVDGGETPYPWAILSDETLHLGLHQRPFPSPTLTYFSWGESIYSRVNLLKKLNLTFDRISNPEVARWPSPNYIAAAEFTAFEGQHIYLSAPWRETSTPNRSFLSWCNQFGELSLRTADLKAALAYWEQFGFKGLASSDQPYPWATLSDGLIRLGLHQSAHLTRPTISYIAPNMPDRLQRLRDQGIPLRSERKDAQGCTIGAVIHSPDGQPFFLFTGQAT